RGAEVVAVDISPKLLRVAEERTPQELKGQITYLAGDMLDERHGQFDHVIAMDSLIHYAPLDILGALGRLTPRVTGSIAFTVAPRTPALAAMHRLGKLFPRADRSPAIHPVGARHLTRLITESLPGWRAHETRRIARGFYISEAWELAR
ncbi:MAG: methyltransferase domain-containing protein, partial [Pseudomonadota bacterium]